MPARSGNFALDERACARGLERVRWNGRSREQYTHGQASNGLIHVIDDVIMPGLIGRASGGVARSAEPPVGQAVYRSREEAVVGRMDAVLIVDDNPDLLEVHAEVLLTLGRFCVYKVRSGLEALRLYASVDPALLILDEGLADIRGSELLRRLRLANSRARRPALFVTGSLSSVQCLPGDIVLEKPVDMQRLLEAVQALVPEGKAGCAALTRCAATATGPPPRAPGG